jgi:hypothetical protein
MTLTKTVKNPPGLEPNCLWFRGVSIQSGAITELGASTKVLGAFLYGSQCFCANIQNEANFDRMI